MRLTEESLPAVPVPATVDQPALFPEESLQSAAMHLGYRGPIACAAAGITYRQLDYWARTGLVEPSIRPANGSGSQRLYAFRDILVLRIVKRLIDTGVSLANIRTAVAHLEQRQLPLTLCPMSNKLLQARATCTHACTLHRAGGGCCLRDWGVRQGGHVLVLRDYGAGVAEPSVLPPACGRAGVCRRA